MKRAFANFFKTLFFFFLFSLVLTAVYATRITHEEMKCPVCDNIFQAPQLMSTNNFGGFDSDLCPHPRGTAYIPVVMLGCPNCNFCGYTMQFKETLTQADKNSLNKWLEENVKRRSDKAQKLASFERYEIAAGLAELQKKPASEIGDLYLKAAWCCRYEGRFYKGNEPENESADQRNKLEPILKQLQEMAETRMPLANDAEFSLNLIREFADAFSKQEFKGSGTSSGTLFIGTFLRSCGENIEAQEWLKNCLAITTSEWEKKEVEAVSNSIALEKEYQMKALPFLVDALKVTKFPEEKTQEYIITIGDTYRRIGEFNQAKKWFEKLLSYDDVPEVFVNIAIKGMKSIDPGFEIAREKLESLENRRIENALSLLSKFPDGQEAARYLRANPNKEKIFPALVDKLRNSDAATTENILIAMPYDSIEAINLQLQLLNKGSHVEVILENFEETASGLALGTLIKMLGEEKDKNILRKVLRVISVIGGEKATEALLQRAEVEFSAETMLKEADYGTEAYEKIDFCREIASELSICDSTAALKPLLKILNSAKDRYLLETAGKSIEFITNHHFGFSFLEKKPGKDSENTSESKDITPKVRLETWLAANSDNSRLAWIDDGFKAFNYKIYPASDPACLDELIKGLTEAFDPIRYHSWMILVQRTGVAFKRSIARNPISFGRANHEVAWRYRNWLKINREKLVWNEKENRFVLKE